MIGQKSSTILFLSLFSLMIFLTSKSEITDAANESSRLAAVQSIVERGTFSIDQSIFQTVDRVRIGGRFYSDKPILPICWLSGIYAILHHIYALDFAESRALTLRLMTFFGVGSFSVLLAYLFRRKIEPLRFSAGWKWSLSAAVVLTTWIFSYGTTLNNHTPAACVLFALFCLLDRPAGSWTRNTALIAGVLAGILFNLDFPTGGIFFLAGAWWIGWRTPSTVAYLAGFSLLVGLMLAADFVAYGNILPAYLVAGGNDFPGSIHSQGYAGLVRPLSIPGYCYNITVGDRGIFSYMPVLLFAIPALSRQCMNKSKTAYITTGALAAVLLYYGTQTGDYGGWAYGFRFLIPLIPILFWYAILWFSDHPGSKLRPVFYAALVVGLITSSVGAYNPWPVAYEGAAQKEGALQQKIRNTFTANLLCIAFENGPESGLTRLLSDRVYEHNVARSYLMLAYLNMRRLDLIDQVKIHMKKEPSEGGR